jgi:hypothetical protein
MARLLGSKPITADTDCGSGQPVIVFRCRQCRKTFCDRFGTAFYNLKTPEEKVKRTSSKDWKACAQNRWRASKASVQRPFRDGLNGPVTKLKPSTKSHHGRVNYVWCSKSSSATHTRVGDEMVEGTARRLASDCWPLWSSDAWEPYLFALPQLMKVNCARPSISSRRSSGLRLRPADGLCGGESV